MRSTIVFVLIATLFTLRGVCQDIPRPQRDSTIDYSRNINHDSVLVDLTSALADPNREILLKDIRYRTFGPITSFRDGKFRVWDTRVYVPMDSISGLYEYRTHGATGAALGFGAVVAAALFWFLPPHWHSWPDEYGNFLIGGVASTVIGWSIGTLKEERHSWPAGELR